jgi:hypothetical protein
VVVVVVEAKAYVPSPPPLLQVVCCPLNHTNKMKLFALHYKIK